MRRTTNDTNSNDPKDLVSRIFIGNLATDQLTRDDLEDIFKKYGYVRGVSVHKGFGFVQYNNEGDARAAVDGETGKYIKGAKIDVCIVIEGKKGYRKKQFPRKDYDDSQERKNIDSYSPNIPIKMPPPGFDPYAAYRGVPVSGHNQSQLLDCEVYYTSHELRRYGESIVERLYTLGLRAVAKLLPDDMSPRLAVEGATRRGLLFCLTVKEENEIHHSMTLNICQDSPQEHRNMPLEAALGLISRTFDEHVRRVKERSEGSKLPQTVGDFIPPDEHTKYLLNLLADDRVLTVEEIDKVMEYLQERRARLVAKNGGIESKSALHLQQHISSLFNNAAVNMHHIPQPVNTNMENANVQKALDNLMSTGPNILRNMTQTQSYATYGNSAPHY
ncbi:DgyrCDS12590 [Dimorphilus gyrociliatus]|nr:DgyrCDS12590 [Dimorphilus gyrociliatus]